VPERERPGEARRGQEEVRKRSGEARKPQESPGEAKRGQEIPGEPKKAHNLLFSWPAQRQGWMLITTGDTENLESRSSLENYTSINPEQTKTLRSIPPAAFTYSSRRSSNPRFAGGGRHESALDRISGTEFPNHRDVF